MKKQIKPIKLKLKAGDKVWVKIPAVGKIVKLTALGYEIAIKDSVGIMSYFGDSEVRVINPKRNATR